jgi:hypothetical protein
MNRNIVVAILIFAFLPSARVFAQGMSDGFRGFKWGSEPTSTMFRTERKANMQGYMMRNDDLNVLGAKANDINYFYYGNGLCRVEISWWPQERTTLDLVKKRLDNAWAKPAKSEEGRGLYNLEWVSATGITSGHFLALEDVRTPQEDWLITIIIQGRQCSRSAIEGGGL